jgi:hypothetical protein
MFPNFDGPIRGIAMAIMVKWQGFSNHTPSTMGFLRNPFPTIGVFWSSKPAELVVGNPGRRQL